VLPLSLGASVSSVPERWHLGSEESPNGRPLGADLTSRRDERLGCPQRLVRLRSEEDHTMEDLVVSLLALASIGGFLIGEPVLGALLGGMGLAVFLFGQSILPWSE
jgi:hypothetical protein